MLMPGEILNFNVGAAFLIGKHMLAQGWTFVIPYKYENDS